MIAECSYATGVCVFADENSEEFLVVCLDPEISYIPPPIPSWVALISDWKEVHGASREAIIESVRVSSSNHRCGSYIEACLAGVSDELLQDLLEEVELRLQAYAEPRGVLRYLLRAPMTNPDILTIIGDTALAYGCGATGAVLAEVAEFQPHLRRFVNAWMKSAPEALAAFDIEAPIIYQRLIDHSAFLDLLNATSPQPIKRVFLDLATEDRDPAYRQACFATSRAVIDALLGKPQIDIPSLADLARMDREAESSEKPMENIVVDSHAAYISTLRQIGAIVDAVADGRDDRAEAYLSDLIAKQTTIQGTKAYAVKSLCNIAKRCADLFRVDFEKRCLEAALQLAPNDSWALTQLADHYKRTGDYVAALDAAEHASGLGGDVVAISSKADILAQCNNIDDAMAAYKSIDNYESMPEIRTAIADLIRRSGDFTNAESEYARIESDGMYSDRVDAGRAEIAKQRGDLVRAQSIYEQLLTNPNLPERSRSVYRYSLAGILKQQGHYLDAYDVVQSLVTELPFFMAAKVLRSSILGLLDREMEGLADIPIADNPKAFGEWWRNYTRGLLLLRVRNFKQARNQLFNNLETAIISEDERMVARLGAAMFFIMTEEYTTALVHLGGKFCVPNEFIEYTTSVLRLHVAAAIHDQELTKSILAIIENRGYSECLLTEAVQLIRIGDFKAAERIELDALLRIAA